MNTKTVILYYNNGKIADEFRCNPDDTVTDYHIRYTHEGLLRYKSGMLDGVEDKYTLQCNNEGILYEHKITL
jgi:hypothetical protein